MSDAHEGDVLKLLEDQGKLLEKLTAQQAEKPDVVASSGKYFKWIQGIIALVAVLISLGVSWGVSSYKLDTLQTDLTKMEVKVERIEEDHEEEIEKLEGSIHTLELAQVRDDQLFKSIEEKLEDMKVLLQGER
jgi:outer membrane murein-binding lipoprotein Lpp